ncbi:hypothetical protein HYU20_02440, partial [Candidatus Woesearchaeota archaeon]|nr:hypothetical protein [Candidatus Woesearchaeota archaeon]
TNFMDTRNRLGSDASHEAFKDRNAAIIEYGIRQGAITRQKADAIIAVVAAATSMQ